MKSLNRNQRGYTLIELMMSVVIVGLIVSIFTPHYDLVLKRAFQSRAKNSLAQMRSNINIYYSQLEGVWPLANESSGDGHTTSIYDLFVPHIVSNIITPLTRDQSLDNNAISQNFDVQAEYHMSQDPKEVVWIESGPAGLLVGVTRPFVYDNITGNIFLANSNLDTKGDYFYDW